jgi:hypothetical protein
LQKLMSTDREQTVSKSSNHDATMRNFRVSI